MGLSDPSHLYMQMIVVVRKYVTKLRYECLKLRMDQIGGGCRAKFWKVFSSEKFALERHAESNIFLIDRWHGSKVIEYFDHHLG